MKNRDGEEFMSKYHELGSLAPGYRSPWIDAELKKSGDNHVYLDARGLGEKTSKNHFPNIYAVCKDNGVDITKDMIPVVPAAHYSCGGCG